MDSRVKPAHDNLMDSRRLHQAKRSKFEYRAVLGNEHAGGAGLVEMGEHERAHVGQHDPAGAQIGQPGLEHLPAEVARHMSGIAVALDDEAPSATDTKASTHSVSPE